jgi:hypothetical protein
MIFPVMIFKLKKFQYILQINVLRKIGVCWSREARCDKLIAQVDMNAKFTPIINDNISQTADEKD